MYYTAQECIDNGFVESLEQINSLFFMSMENGSDKLPTEYKDWRVLHPNLLENRLESLYFPTPQDKEEYLNE